MGEAWWSKVSGSQLAQGDLLPKCLLPVFTGNSGDEAVEEYLVRARLIIVTQSCDLENDKAPNVALYPIHKLDEFEAINEAFARFFMRVGLPSGIAPFK
ncbi:MAG: hypothetical protein J5I93_30395 [Pirellulaceae bacterium]|nr:hypothetical protein [Pirellulaceae bacterium]